ncbi:MAG: pimeloyl-ACP methyl ester esterase BioH [Gammaproteobacteria bacterium]
MSSAQATSAARPAGLHVASEGSGPDLVLVHGWGLHSGVWAGVRAALALGFRVTLVDLPGHGASGLEGPFTLSAVAAQLLAAAPPQALWVGWSLGGLLSLYIAARHPARVRALVLAAATPRFVRAADWPAAMDPATFDQFAAELERDHRATLKRFLALQTLGTPQARSTLQALQRACLEGPPPAPEALRGGLDILRHADLRSELGRVRCPVLLYMGERDRLVPAAGGAQIAAALPHAQLQLVPGAGHAPFVSQPRAFVEALERFAHDTATR